MRGFEQYDLAIYIDGNVKIIDPKFVETIVGLHRTDPFDFAMTKHEERNTASEEIRACIRQTPKYARCGLNLQLKIVSNCSQQLCWCGFNIQWLKSPRWANLKACFETWWNYLLQDPVGICNDQIVWPKAYDESIQSQRQFNFKVLAPEYLQNHWFSVILVGQHGKPKILTYYESFFPSKAYQEANPDLDFMRTPAQLFDHWRHYGALENRFVFDHVYYANKYPDLKAALGDNKQRLLEHWRLYGRKEGRVCGPVLTRLGKLPGQ